MDYISILPRSYQKLIGRSFLFFLFILALIRRDLYENLIQWILKYEYNNVIGSLQWYNLVDTFTNWLRKWFQFVLKNQ